MSQRSFEELLKKGFFGELMEAGDELRTRRVWLRRWSRRLSRACRIYEAAWTRFPSHPERWRAAQQAGVVYRMRRQLQQAQEWFSRADKAAIYDLDRASIQRDLGITLSDLRQHDQAIYTLELSQAAFGTGGKPGEFPAEWGASTYMLARAIGHSGRPKQARELFELALLALRGVDSVDARMQELYCLGHYADLEGSIHWTNQALTHAQEARALARSYGSPSHIIKAYWVTLRVAVWRLRDKD